MGEEKKIPLKYYRWFRNSIILTMFVAPVLGYLYMESKMKTMEKGIHDDLARIESKGKTLGDIPRKRVWTNMISFEQLSFAFALLQHALHFAGCYTISWFEQAVRKVVDTAVVIDGVGRVFMIWCCVMCWLYLIMFGRFLASLVRSSVPAMKQAFNTIPRQPLSVRKM